MAAADADVAEGPPAVADPPGREADQGEGAEEAGEQVEEDGLAARRRGVAAHRDPDRVDCGRRGRLRAAASWSCRSCARRAQQAAELVDEHGAGGRQARPTARPTVARSERAQPKRVRGLRARRLDPRRQSSRSSARSRGSPHVPAGASTAEELLLLADDRLHRGDGAVGELDLDHEGAELRAAAARAGRVCFSIRRSRASRSASTISLAPTEPNSLPSSPARWWIVSTVLPSRPAASASRSARAFSAFSAASRRRCASSSAPGRRRLGQLARDQVVAQVAGGDVDRLAALAERLDVLRAGSPAPSALSDVGQQGDLARPLHRHRELSLVAAGKSGDAPAAGLPLVGEEAPQQVEVLVVDGLGVDPRVLARPGAVGAAAVRGGRRCLMTLSSS